MKYGNNFHECFKRLYNERWKAKGLKPQEFCDEINKRVPGARVCASTVSSWKNYYQPSQKFISAICDILECDQSDLMCWKKLGDVLKKVDGRQDIKIGCRAGFCYIGKKRDLRNDIEFVESVEEGFLDLKIRRRYMADDGITEIFIIGEKVKGQNHTNFWILKEYEQAKEEFYERKEKELQKSRCKKA